MKKRSLLLALLALLPLGFSACSQGEEDPLSISVGDSHQFFIPAKTTSCKNRRIKDAPTDDVASFYFQFRNVTFSWTDPKSNAYISFIQIEYSTGDDTTPKKCSIGGDDLLALNDDWWDLGRAIVGGPNYIKDDGNPYVPKTTLRISNCGMTCGNISVSETTFTSSATIKVVGFKDDGSGQRVPISTTTSVTLENK